MIHLKSMLPALMVLTLSAGTGLFAQSNSAAGHGNGKRQPES